MDIQNSQSPGSWDFTNKVGYCEIQVKTILVTFNLAVLWSCPVQFSTSQCSRLYNHAKLHRHQDTAAHCSQAKLPTGKQNVSLRGGWGRLGGSCLLLLQLHPKHPREAGRQAAGWLRGPCAWTASAPHTGIPAQVHSEKRENPRNCVAGF